MFLARQDIDIIHVDIEVEKQRKSNMFMCMWDLLLIVAILKQRVNTCSSSTYSRTPNGQPPIEQ